MKKSYLVLSFILFVCSLNAQIIAFSDSAFKAKLLDSGPSNFIARDLNGDYFAIDANSNGEIEIAEALQVGFLQIDNSSISSLNEINNFTNLIELDCENNFLTTLDISSLLSLTILNCSNNQVNSLNVNGLTELQNLNCQFNQLTTLNAGGITNLLNLNCSYNQIQNLNLSNLLNLEMLYCNDNVINAFDLSDLISLTNFDCSNNQLSSINTGNLVSLETLNCNSNLLVSLAIDGLVNFNNLNCSNNQISSLTFNNLQELTNLNCANNQLSSLNLNGSTQLENLDCANNTIVTIDLSSLNQVISLNFNSNQLTNLDISTLTNLKYLYCNFNTITTLNLNDLEELLVLSCSNNQIDGLNLSTATNLQSLYCSNNEISTLDLGSLSNLQNLFCANNELVSLFIKNGSFENNLQFSGNPNLEFICADESQIDFVQEEINNNSYTNCHVNTYCSFVPGGISYSIQGNSKFDSNSNGCDGLDSPYPDLQLSISDGTLTENLIANSSGSYSKSVKSGTYTVTPILENSNYFSVAPAIALVEFPVAGSPFIQNFCVSANGNHPDIEIAIVPLENAIPGLDADYKIIYKNKGTIMQSGSVTLNFNDSVLDLVQSNPIVTSQNTNNLNWSFTNLNPFETRTILLTLHVNSASDIFPVNVGQILPFIATVVTPNTDETPNDNIIRFNQSVIAGADSNNKVCIEGSSISTSQVGEYVHYCIRFKNNGTSIAQNVVIKDIIDLSKYDFTTLLPIDGSHAFETRLTNLNTAEFIFENINLALSGEGYVMFKIKTLPTLSNGDTFSNTASIYFDYLAPLSTNTESTTVQVLANQTFEATPNFTVYPNPVNEVLNIYSKNLNAINSIAIYNSLGQLMKMIVNPNNSIDVSEFTKGIYFITINAENGISTVKFIKE